MKNQVMVWLAAASLHEQRRAPFQRKALLQEARRLFPESNPVTISSYVDIHVNVSGSLPNSFSYIIRTLPGVYSLTTPAHETPTGKPRWPDRLDVDTEYLALWDRWKAWQEEQDVQSPTELQRRLEEHLLALLPSNTTVERNGLSIIIRRSSEITVQIEPDRLFMQIVKTYWDGHTPLPQVERELTLRLDDTTERGVDSTALGVVSVLHAVFGTRLASYVRCEDCGEMFAPEQMTEGWCHGCATNTHGVVY